MFPILVGLSPLACDETYPASSTSRLACPEGWISTASGGCGPAVLLCAPDAGAPRGACEGVWPVAPRAVTDEDGTPGVAPYTLDGRRIGGGWGAALPPCPDSVARDEDGACAWPVPPPDGALPSGGAAPVDPARCDAAPRDDGETVFVRADAVPPFEGTAARPFATLRDALAQTPAGRRIYLGPGTYVAPPRIVDGRSILGACAAQVRIVTGPGTPLEVSGPAAALTLASVRIDGPPPCVQVSDGARATLDAVQAPWLRVTARATVTARDVALGGEDTLADEVVVAVDAASLALVNSRVDARVGDGVAVVGDGAAVRLDRVAVQVRGAVGVRFGEATTGTLSRVTIDGPGEAGALFDHARATIDGLAVRGAGWATENLYHSGGIVLEHQANVTASEVLVSDVRVDGVAARDPQTRGAFDRLVVRRVRALGPTGTCIDANDGATVAARRAVLHHCVHAGAQASEFARIDLRDAWVHDIDPDAHGLYGFGVAALNFGGLTLRRALLEGVAMGGAAAMGIPAERLARVGLARELLVRGAIDTTLSLEDVIVRDARPRTGQPAFGVVVGAGVTAVASRVALTGVRGIGLAATRYGYPTAALAQALERSGRVPTGSAALFTTLLGPSLDGVSTITSQDLFVQSDSPWTVGLDVDALDRAPTLEASVGVYAGNGCAVRLTRATLEGGSRGEYGLVSQGDITASGLRVSAHRRCAVGVGGAAIDARATLTDTSVQGTPRCEAVGLEAVRLPLSTD